MPTIYKFDEQFIATGETREISASEGAPFGWTRTAPPETIGTQVAQFSGRDGWALLAEAPTALPAPVPQVVTMRQARLALLQQGLLASIQPAIDSLDEPSRSAASIEWEYSQTVERNRPFVQLLSQALELTDEDLDALFTLAATL